MSSYGTNGTKERDNGRPDGRTIGTGQGALIGPRPVPVLWSAENTNLWDLSRWSGRKRT